MSFDASVFVAEKFDCEKFVTDLRKDGTTLEDLSVSLEAFVETLNGNLVSMIEKDYSAFLKLSAMLVNIDSMVAVLREPIEHVVTRVDELSASVRDPFNEQRDLLLKLHAVRHKRKLLELNISAWESLRKVEVEVERLRQADTDADNDVLQGNENTRPADLERAAQRLAMVTFLTRQGEHHDMPLLRHIKARTRGLQQALTEQLEVAFGMEIVPDNFNNLESHYVNADSLCRVLRSYVAINQVDLAHQVFRKLLVTPFLERSFTVGRLDGGERGSCKGLGGMYEEVIKFVVKVCKPIFEVLSNPEWGLSSQFDFMGSGIGVAVKEALSAKLSQVYTSGVADTLHYTYRTTEAFFEILETLSSKPDFVKDITKETLGRWNLTVYKQLRRKEMLASLESQLNASTIEVLSDGNADVADICLSPTRVLWSNFRSCHDPENVFLPPVALDLFRVKLELLEHYCQWAQASVDPETQLSCWQNVPFRTRINVAKDSAVLRGKLQEDTTNGTTLRAMFPARADAAKGFVNDAFALFESRLEECAEAIRKSVRDVISDECVTGLNENLKGIVGIYRLSNHSPPTKASDFVATLLEPLVSFRGEHKEEADLMKKEVVTYVCVEYTNQAQKIVEEVKNTEAALRRFRRKAKPDSAAASTSESLTKQFALDVEELGNCAVAIGVEVQAMEEYVSLQDLFAQES